MPGNASIAAPLSIARFPIIAERVWLAEDLRLLPLGREILLIAETGLDEEAAQTVLSDLRVCRDKFILNCFRSSEEKYCHGSFHGVSVVMGTRLFLEEIEASHKRTSYILRFVRNERHITNNGGRLVACRTVGLLQCARCVSYERSA